MQPHFLTLPTFPNSVRHVAEWADSSVHFQMLLSFIPNSATMHGKQSFRSEFSLFLLLLVS